MGTNKTVIIKTRFGEVTLSSDRKSEKMGDLVGNAVSIIAQLIPEDEKKVIPEAVK